MRILLIRPPYSRLKGMGQSPYFPLGLGYIAAVLRENGHEVAIYHAENPKSNAECVLPDADIGFNFRSKSYHRYLDALKDDTHFVWAEVRETLRDYKPDMVGISLLSVEVGSSLKISQLVKEYSPNCYVLWGGLHPSFLTDESLSLPVVDFVIRGEGEYSTLELCRALENRTPLTQVESLSFKENGKIIHNPVRRAIENVDAIPFPARDAVLYPERFDFKSLGSMIVSRGCPFRCTFCSSRNFWDKKCG